MNMEFIEIKDLQGHIHFIRRIDILRMRYNGSNGIYTIYYNELSFDGKNYLVGIETRQVPILIDGLLRNFYSEPSNSTRITANNAPFTLPLNGKGNENI